MPRNNFTLIRLLAAGQVLVYHLMRHIHDGPAAFSDVWNRVPGVIVFFVVSGFLIAPSLERSRTVGEYARKRIVRIYPALYVCLAVSLLSAMVIGGYSDLWHWNTAGWLAAQLTFGQFKEAHFLDGYGTGHLAITYLTPQGSEVHHDSE